MKRQILTAVVLVMASLWTLVGCHTVKGVGQDVQGAGSAIERSSGK